MSVNQGSTHLSQYAPLESRETAVQFMESIPVGIYIMKMDVEGNPSFSYVSDRFLDMFGLDRQAVLSDAYVAFNCVHPEDYDEFVALNQKVFKECIPFYWEGRCVVRGETIWVIAESIPRKLASGDIIWEGSSTDITKQKIAELQLKKNEAHIRSLLDNSPVPTAINSMDNGTVTYLNQSFTETFGYTLSDIPTVSDWAVKAYPNRQYREEVFAKWNASVETAKTGNQKVPPSELQVVCKDGRTKEIIIEASFMDEMLLVSLIDITERKLVESAVKAANEEKIRFLTHFDPLTNLPNRSLCKILLQAAIDRAKTQSNRAAVLLIDLDDFKHINKNYSYATGDLVLTLISGRIRDHLGEFDSVCRLLSDEFVIILSDIESLESTEVKANRVLEAIGQPILVNQDSINLTASIGATVFPDHGSDAETLLQNTEFAISHAKNKNKNHSFQLFHPVIRDQSTHRAQLFKDLHRALKNKEFFLLYQPQIDLSSGQIIGLETLLRWNDGGLEVRLPNTFIPIAEQSNLIVEIGEWVFIQACTQLMKWEKSGLPIPSIGINLSAVQFIRSDVVTLAEKVLRETGIDPQKIDLELTESAVMRDEKGEIADQINRLSAMGMKLSVDDFGTGYSSLTYLKKFPIDRLKIDQSFIGNIDSNNADRAIVQSIINLAQSLDIQSIAEGVERQATLDLLKEMGCHQVQGFFLGRPMQADAIEKLIFTAPHSSARS